MFSKFNLFPIVLQQIETLRSPSDPRPSLREVGFFFLFPLIVAIALVFSTFSFKPDVIGAVISAASIFAGLLLNLLVLLVTISLGRRPSTGDLNEQRLVGRLLWETCVNVSYCLVVCLVLVGACLYSLVDPIDTNWLGRLVLFYFGVSMFLSTLQVLKRVFRLVDHFVKPGQ